jgi:hypothetical protein
MLSKKEPGMIDLNESQKRDIRMYGITEAELREEVEQDLTYRYSSPAMLAASLMSDAQEMIDPEYGKVNAKRTEYARQFLNRAKWVLFEYCMKETA